MSSRISNAVRNTLAVFGAMALVVVAAAAGFAAYSYATNKPRHDRATKADVRFVLNWPGLGEDRIETVVRSYESAVHFSGDHFTVYAIRVTSLAEAELSAESRWVRGDRADALMREAVQFVTEAPHEVPWFPSADELLSDKYYIWRWRVEVGEHVSAAWLIFARPADRMMFYASLQV